MSTSAASDPKPSETHRVVDPSQSQSPVSPSAGPSHKTTAACANCRQRKIKCPGERPVCTNCAKSNSECFYPRVASRKRRRRLEGASEAATAGSSTDPVRWTGEEQWFPGGTIPQGTNSFALSTIWSNAAYSQNLPASAGSTLDWTVDSSFGETPLTHEHSSGSIDNTNSALDVLLAFDAAFPTSLLSQPSPTTISPSAGAFAYSGRRTKLRIPYFRFFGPTAIAPGYKNVTSNVSRAPSPTSRLNEFALGQVAHATFAPAPFDMFPDVEALSHLVPIFRAHFGYMFSFVRLPAIPVTLDSLPQHHASLLNIVCALAARYSPQYGLDACGIDPPCEEMSSQWATRAKEQAGRDLAISSPELVQTLLLISWYEFGGDRDAGLWMYSGMAFRMAQDLGLDTLARSEGIAAPQDDQLMRLHGTLRMMDAIMTIGTGRQGMFNDSSWAVPTFPPLIRPGGMQWPDPLGYLIRMFVYVDKVTRVLVDQGTSRGTPELTGTQSELSEFYNGMPQELRFNATSLGSYSVLGRGAGFVLLHVWFHALVILTYCPDLINSSTGISLSPASDTASREVAVSSAKSISDIVSFAELIDAKSVRQPWINYPLYLAARVFLSKCEGLPGGGSENPMTAAQLHISRAARQGFDQVMTMLGTVERYWNGVKYIRRALDQKAEGIEQVDLRDESDVVLPDLMAMLEQATTNRNDAEVVGLSLSGTVDALNNKDFGYVLPST